MTKSCLLEQKQSVDAAKDVSFCSTSRLDSTNCRSPHLPGHSVAIRTFASVVLAVPQNRTLSWPAHDSLVQMGKLDARAEGDKGSVAGRVERGNRASSGCKRRSHLQRRRREYTCPRRQARSGDTTFQSHQLSTKPGLCLSTMHVNTVTRTMITCPTQPDPVHRNVQGAWSEACSRDKNSRFEGPKTMVRGSARGDAAGSGVRTIGSLPGETVDEVEERRQGRREGDDSRYGEGNG